jgi:hypothetical protein
VKPRIPYTKPSITELEVRYATDAAANRWGERCYAYIECFENSFKVTRQSYSSESGSSPAASRKNIQRTQRIVGGGVGTLLGKVALVFRASNSNQI